MIRFLLVLCAAMLAAIPPTQACVPEFYSPFEAVAQVRQVDGSWRNVSISSFGGTEADERWQLAWTVRLESAGQITIVDTLRGSAEVRVPGRDVFVSSPEDAIARFGLSPFILEADNRLYLDDYAPEQDLRRFLDRPCALHRRGDAWACFDRTGFAIVAGPRLGEVSYRVTSISERRPSRSRFVMSNGLSQRAESQSGASC